MKTVAYYISDYGYGHASRSIAIIREMFRIYKGNLKVIICNSNALNFLKDSLSGLNIQYREVNTDVGYILKPDSIDIDKTKLKESYLEFIEDWNIKLLKEIDFLSTQEVDLVISDISPLPFIPSKDLGIPSVGVSNFTWYTAYRNLIDEKYLTTFKKSYKSMDALYALEGHKEPNWTTQNKSFGFIARTVDYYAVKMIKDRINPTGEKTIVFLGLGMNINVDIKNLKIFEHPQYTFIVSANTSIVHPNVYRIPDNYIESQNYIAVSDVIISKAGWGTVSEALINDVQLVILNREYMNEDKNTIDYLKSINKVQLIDWKDLEELDMGFNLLRDYNALSSKEVYNEVALISSELLKLLD